MMYKITENLYLDFNFSEKCDITGNVPEYLITILSEDYYLRVCGDGIRQMSNILQEEGEKELYGKEICSKKGECYFCDRFLKCSVIYNKNDHSENLYICHGCLQYLEKEYDRIGRKHLLYSDGKRFKILRYKDKRKITDSVVKDTIKSEIYLVIARNGPGGIDVDISNVEKLMIMLSNPHDYDCISIRDERHRRHFCHTCNNRDTCGLTIDTAFLCHRCIGVLKRDIREAIKENSDEIFPYLI